MISPAGLWTDNWRLVKMLNCEYNIGVLDPLDKLQCCLIYRSIWNSAYSWPRFCPLLGFYIFLNMTGIPNKRLVFQNTRKFWCQRFNKFTCLCFFPQLCASWNPLFFPFSFQKCNFYLTFFVRTFFYKQ